MESHSKRNVGRPVPGTNRRRLDGKPSGKTDWSGAGKLGEKTLKKKSELKSRRVELTKKLTSQKGKTEGSAGEKMIFNNSKKKSKEALT